VARTPLRRDRPRGRRRARAPHLLAGLAAASLLLHGWLPILLQVSVLAPAAGAHGHAAHARGAAPPGKSPECPLFHGAICLCASFAKLLPAPAGPAPARLPATRAARRRRAVRRPPPRRRTALFDARAPPRSD
jgi:hypothetical protein